jgi:translation elongation factor P/translation initiation factor 5A
MSRLKKKKQDKSKAVESVIDPTLKIAHNVKKGDVVVLKEVPVRITRTKLSRRRKKYRKVILIGNNIFTGEKVKDVIPQMDPVDHPEIANEQFKLHSLLPDLKVKLELKDGTFREDLKLPKREMQEQIRSYLEEVEQWKIFVCVVKCLGLERIENFWADPPSGS